MAAASEPPRALLARAVRGTPASLREPGHRCDEGTHSTLADGRRVCWRPEPVDGVRFVVDAELTDRPVPPALARRHPESVAAQSFWRDWVVAEVHAKALDVPILLLASGEAGWPWPLPTESSTERGTLVVQVEERGPLVLAFGALVGPTT